MITGSQHLNNTSTNTNGHITFKVHSDAQMTSLAVCVKTQSRVKRHKFKVKM